MGQGEEKSELQAQAALELFYLLSPWVTWQVDVVRAVNMGM